MALWNSHQSPDKIGKPLGLTPIDLEEPPVVSTLLENHQNMILTKN